MIKKVFALASITALAGVVSAVGAAGCSDSVDAGAGDDSGSTDAKAKDAGKECNSCVDASEPEPPFGSTCGTIDATKFPYTKALEAVGACTAEEAAALAAFMKTKSEAKEDVKVVEWAAVVSDTCSQCVFSDGKGSTWTPLLVNAAKDQLDAVNRGGCIELLSGKESCGRAYQQATDCRLEACLKCVGIQDEFSMCLTGKRPFEGPCKTAYDRMQTECGPDLAKYETGCKGTAWTFEGPIKVQCITGGSSDLDAGKDAN